MKANIYVYGRGILTFIYPRDLILPVITFFFEILFLTLQIFVCLCGIGKDASSASAATACCPIQFNSARIKQEGCIYEHSLEAI